MTGEAEKMPPVVQEFVDIHAGDQRRGALLRADEIEREQEEKSAEDRPRHDLTERDRLRSRQPEKVRCLS